MKVELEHIKINYPFVSSVK